MSVRNSHARTSSPYVYKYIDGIQYQFTSATYVLKSKTYYLVNKAVKGKVVLNPQMRGMEIQEDGTLRYYKI